MPPIKYYSEYFDSNHEKKENYFIYVFLDKDNLNKNINEDRRCIWEQYSDREKNLLKQ